MTTNRKTKQSITSASTPPRGLLELLGIESIDTWDLRVAWDANQSSPALTFPIGYRTGASRVTPAAGDTPVATDDGGEAEYLSIGRSTTGDSEAHGLGQGATGFGKSALLTAWVTGLVTAHGPERLSVLLVDGRGGGLFSEFEGIPHCAGIAQLRSDDDVNELNSALLTELNRRMVLLRRHGFGDLAEYRAAPEAIPPVPDLVVVLDEAQAPGGLHATLTYIMRIGPSLGVYLIAFAQDLAELDAGMRLNASFRVSMRATAASSQTVLGIDGAERFSIGEGALRRNVYGVDAVIRFVVADVNEGGDEGTNARALNRVLERVRAVDGAQAVRQIWRPSEADMAWTLTDLFDTAGSRVVAGLGGNSVTFSDERTAQMVRALHPVDGSVAPGIRKAAIAAGFAVPGEGRDIGERQSPASMRPGDIIVGKDRAGVYLGDGKALSGGTVRLLADIAKFDDAHTGVFRIDGGPAAMELAEVDRSRRAGSAARNS